MILIVTIFLLFDYMYKGLVTRSPFCGCGWHCAKTMMWAKISAVLSSSRMKPKPRSSFQRMMVPLAVMVLPPEWFF